MRDAGAYVMATILPGCRPADNPRKYGGRMTPPMRTPVVTTRTVGDFRRSASNAIAPPRQLL